MEEKDIKNILEDGMESPSYGFSTKTMRKIEILKTSKTRISIKDHSSVVVYLIPLVLLSLIVSTFFLTDSQFTSIDFASTLPDFKSSWISFNIHFSWLLASLAIAAGFWTWIWWEKKNFRFR